MNYQKVLDFSLNRFFRDIYVRENLSSLRSNNSQNVTRNLEKLQFGQEDYNSRREREIRNRSQREMTG